MSRILVGIVAGFLLLSLIFGVIERLFPAIRGRRWLRAGFATDLTYWVFTPLVTKHLTKLGLVLTLVPVLALVLWISGRPVSRESFDTWLAGFGPLGSQPVWLQAIEMIVLGDFIAYWMHRRFHRGWWWPFHAVHHSSTELDWLGSVRLHPFNDVAMRVIQALPLVLLGFSVKAAAAYSGFLTFFAIMLHANVSWDFGPLRAVIASPRFHRWHHSCEAEALDKNFAGFLPLWDILFGTYYMPRDRQPTQFGVPDAVPKGLWGQLVYPFRRRTDRAISDAAHSEQRFSEPGRLGPGELS